MNKRIAKKVLRSWPHYNVATLLNKGPERCNRFPYTPQQIEHALFVNGRDYRRHEAAALARRKGAHYERWGRWDPHREWHPRFAQIMRAKALPHSLLASQVNGDIDLISAIKNMMLAKAGV